MEVGLESKSEQKSRTFYTNERGVKECDADFTGSTAGGKEWLEKERYLKMNK